jgi:uncharacterized protein
VPEEATARVRHYARAFGLPLKVLDTGEFADPDYLANPVNRCLFCKSHLYDGILARLAEAAEPGWQVAAGTNRDDLGDYRPGLEAARARGILHPLVEAGLDKAALRRLAARLGLGEIADLPAAPCLASRVETGLRIEPEVLRAIDAIETTLRARLGRVTLRCRRRAEGLVIEIDAAVLAGLDAADRAALAGAATATARARGLGALPLSLQPYRMGSAFLHG